MTPVLLVEIGMVIAALVLLAAGIWVLITRSARDDSPSHPTEQPHHRRRRHWRTRAHTHREHILAARDDDTLLGVLAALRQAVIVLDSDDEVLHASPAAYTYNLVAHDAIREPRVAQMVERARVEGQAQDAELEVARGRVAGAGSFSLHVRAARLSGGRILVLVDDRTAEKRLEETRRDFVVNISHELKTPVGAIGLLAETIESGADDPEVVRHFAPRLRTEATRLSNLVQEIIELSRLQDGDALRSADVVDIDAVITESIDRVRVAAQAADITVAAGGLHGLTVRGDAGLIATAVRNLLENAIRYSEPRTRVSIGVSTAYSGDHGETGRAPGQLTADASGIHIAALSPSALAPTQAAHGTQAGPEAAPTQVREPDLVRIAVVDQGIGIAKEDQARVFERFYRVDKARSRATGGTGLGLSIVKHVAADHGGTVELWSAPGRGSTFTLVLPRLLPSTASPASPANPAAPETPDTPPTPDSPGTKGNEAS